MPSIDDFAEAASLEGVPSALTAARDAVDVILRDRGRKATTPQMTTDSLLIGAAASARLAGSRTDLEALRAGSADEIAIAAARTNARLLALVPVVQRSPIQALARLHTLVAAGRVDEDSLGRPRAATDAVDALQKLGGLLVRPTRAPALAVAALAHAQIATLQPFEEGNGLVARALERLLLVARGVDPASVLVPEAGHADQAGHYEEALAQFAAGTAAGSRSWLLYAAEAITASLPASPLVR